MVNGDIFNTATAAQILEASGVMRGYFAHYRHIFGSRPLLLTEWGILGTIMPTFLHSLGQASQMMAILELAAASAADGAVAIDIVQAGIHILYATNHDAMALFTFDEACNATVATPTGVWYKKLVDTLVGSTLLGSTVVAPTLPQGSPGVEVQAARDSKGILVIVMVNKLGIAANVSMMISGLAGALADLSSEYRMEVFQEPPLSWNTHALDSDPWVVTSGVGPELEIPPLSVSVVRFG